MVIVDAEKITRTKATRLKTWLVASHFINEPPNRIRQPDVKGKTVEIPGVSFLVPRKISHGLVDTINRLFNYRNHYAFISDDSTREDKKVTLSIVRGENPYNILRLQQTNGINFGISTDSLITALKAFGEKYPYTILEADFDRCLLRLEREPDDWVAMSKEVLKLCPSDEVTPEQVAEALRAEKGIISLWWD
ncbi:DUF4253 domain-containing protein [Paraflavitalea speifideaquila]|uniref:DUF4253 domain-containing protein n=1 Tax=Paraflavitalea speifideaquila TaxID=3076558 RepID=UPI0028E37667|nr:DUF4253 domain-containing protein [Paraflavitalea speifideiaquila]